MSVNRTTLIALLLNALRRRLPHRNGYLEGYRVVRPFSAEERRSRRQELRAFISSLRRLEQEERRAGAIRKLGYQEQL